MEKLIEISNRLIRNVSDQFTRSLYQHVNWKNKLIEIRGPRGVGKTTLMLQHAKKLSNKNVSVLYVSLDNAYFFRNRLTDLADNFYKYGGKYIFIDEVHKYPVKEKGLDWSLEIKNIYDSYPGLFLIYSGSSILKIHQGTGDLSRRKASYHLPGLSFREYLLYNEAADYPVFQLADIFQKQQQLCSEITNDIKILPHFKNYLTHGYYPFYRESGEVYLERLNNIVNVIVETDIPAVTDIHYDTSVKLKKLFSLLASSVPFSPNLSKLAAQLSIADSRTLLKYLNYLEKAELIKTLGAKASGNQLLNKPEKIYLDNTNLMHAISTTGINEGTMRETFIINQLNQVHHVNYPKQGDVTIDDVYTVEVGGKNKSMNQVVAVSDAYVAADEIETGFGSKVPLWLFGFLY